MAVLPSCNGGMIKHTLFPLPVRCMIKLYLPSKQEYIIIEEEESV